MIRRNSFRRVLSSLHRIIASHQIIVFSAFTLGLSACYNEPNFLGGDLIPSEDKTSVQLDTSFVVAAYTIGTDTISTGIYKNAVLGCYNSPLFGKIKSDFRSRILVYRINDTILPKMKPRPEPISLELTMTLAKTWGTEKMPINVKVYELRDSLENGKYYNGLAAPSENYYPTPISLPTTYSGDSLLTIKLTDDFARKLINASDTALTYNPKFIKYVKGLYITSDDYSGPNGVMYFFNYNIKLELKYQFLKKGVLTDTTFSFYTSSGSQRYNHFNHFDHAGASIKPLISDTTNQNPVFYMEGLGGTRGLIKLKGAKEWAKKMPIAIHRAELRFDVQEESEHPRDSIIFPINYYYKKLPFNKLFDSETYDDDPILDKTTQVKYNKAKKFYSFDVTLHVQNILRGKVERNYFYLEPSDFKIDYNQGIFRSGNNIKPMKLIITYTKL